ncbi:hypothetical protein [Ottowia sp. SB7-C50]|uniref:hypothetical protein n=1 Tax=Ottowia sp. SB7-C50 TaxID=3081231 RepID=UPI002953F0E1|nr:hypothetical protein [Ottowia sp. SB7-C50]WOP14656.1 hypothetical protein R0D99_12475 [Ottowia sp. SB7-C50]
MTAPVLRLAPTHQATLSLLSPSGALAMSAAPQPAIAAQLAPIYRGDPGPAGAPAPEPDLPDLTVIFDNKLI